ncbi:unnamed protein product [Spirodela intermedia]|uniref:Uncharacterized protein n=1 Tax=Spirodela intermedia TaxID=51605 RepID=A0A7I8J3W4_SPIIN|nr:unnamed protein product [Spirodela intermedia]CAA6664751.1 unnamed protein product [Spirodela intermedia]
MDRRKRRTGSDEGLALVKAAAWAWYQRGVGDEGMPAREVHTPKPPREPRPSRFKLEAAAAAGSGGVGGVGGASDLPRSSRPERAPRRGVVTRGKTGASAAGGP